eukprot:8930271-Alexandrium_andersonii.AAC.1
MTLKIRSEGPPGPGWREPSASPQKPAQSPSGSSSEASLGEPRGSRVGSCRDIPAFKQSKQSRVCLLYTSPSPRD